MLAAAASITADQEHWHLWTWDEYRVCRAASVQASSDSSPGEDMLTTDRPCSWRLAYVCAEESAVLAAGFTSSTAWYRTHFLESASGPEPSPYALGPGASGLRLVRSGLLLGDPNPQQNITVAFNDTEAFWQHGPVVSALYRSGNHKLLALRLLREREADDGWALYRNQSRITGAAGALNVSLDQGPPYELYNVGPFRDYIIAVQGCFSSRELEMLFFVTRTGRQYQLGRGGCTHWFREESPAGGYLAGMAGRHMDAPAWAKLPESVKGMPPMDVAWLNQVLKLVDYEALGIVPVRFIPSSTYMGLSWSLVTAGDALDWYTSMDTRRGAYAAISAGGNFWVQSDGADASQATTGGCIRAACSVPFGQDLWAHRFTPSSCDAHGMVICKATVGQGLSTIFQGGRVPMGAPGLQWTAGPHLLSGSRRLGKGPFGEACAFSLGARLGSSDGAPSGANAGLPLNISTGGNVTVTLTHRLSSVAISTSVQSTNSTDPVAVVGALRLGLKGLEDGAEMESAAAGVASSAGWHSVELSPGEVVVAVSGCAGGFVERLVLHTSAGRMWTTPFSAASLCSVPFLEVAPPGAYLVGVQAADGPQPAAEWVPGRSTGSADPASHASGAERVGGGYGGTGADGGPGGGLAAFKMHSEAEMSHVLEEYIRANSTLFLECPAQAATQLPADRVRENAIPDDDIAYAIQNLQTELSGRQEQITVLSVLGKGSYGVVYLGKWRELRVAIKAIVIHGALLDKEGVQLQRAISEAAISKALQTGDVFKLYIIQNILLSSRDPSTDTPLWRLHEIMAIAARTDFQARLEKLWRPPVIAKVGDFGLR
ncbi:hypothetical protein GPECTOR_52g39 [Gonium pectorale]|uniref:Protein kinase domain-containing protein n=1 Tax=Gonium pectorale TaxID=33097 RepID=A0A150G732_GONPE|nr:hypothetical protein GPECTOR_52g39 [Gonium pectorale]|eukprot:KXZ45638.1 hypothetical protein GPECTOR_52g39 [Gonium pectorale]